MKRPDTERGSAAAFPIAFIVMLFWLSAYVWGPAWFRTSPGHLVPGSVSSR